MFAGSSAPDTGAAVDVPPGKAASTMMLAPAASMALVAMLVANSCVARGLAPAGSDSEITVSGFPRIVVCRSIPVA